MKKVTAEVIEKNRYLVTVEVEDNATDGDIYDAIVRAYIGDDTYMGDSCKVIEQYIYDVTNTIITNYLACTNTPINGDSTWKRYNAYIKFRTPDDVTSKNTIVSILRQPKPLTSSKSD